MPQSARLSAGGCNRYLGNAQIEVTLSSKGLPLRSGLVIFRGQKGKKWAKKGQFPKEKA